MDDSGKEDRRRLQVSVSRRLQKELLRLADLEERDVAWVCGHLIALCLDQDGKKSFTRWLGKRLLTKEASPDQFRQTASAEKVRIHVVVSGRTSAGLAEMAERMDCTPVKLGGLLLDHGVDTYAVWFRILATPLGGLIRRLVNGRPEEDPPLHTLPIGWHNLPWLRDLTS